MLINEAMPGVWVLWFATDGNTGICWMDRGTNGVEALPVGAKSSVVAAQAKYTKATPGSFSSLAASKVRAFVAFNTYFFQSSRPSRGGQGEPAARSLQRVVHAGR